MKYYWINLPSGGLVPGGKPVSYAIRHGCANCMKMTRWEALERVKQSSDVAPLAGFDNEWIGARISFPTRKLVLKAKFPQNLAMVQPHIGAHLDP